MLCGKREGEEKEQNRELGSGRGSVENRLNRGEWSCGRAEGEETEEGIHGSEMSGRGVWLLSICTRKNHFL